MSAASAKTAPVKNVKSVIIGGWEYSYAPTGTTASGRHAYDAGDAVAVKLRGKTLDEAYAIAAADLFKRGLLRGCLADCKSVAAVEKALRESLKDANPGRQRMTLGNRMRAGSKKADA